MKKVLILSILLLTVNFIMCDKDKNPVSPEETESAVQTFNTNAFGTVGTASGHVMEIIAGTVPLNQNGQAGNVAFSIESPVESPADLPSVLSQASGVTRFGPEGFIFHWPVRTVFPYPENSNPTEMNILRYDDLEEKWKTVPASFVDPINRLIGCDMLQLGNAVLANFSSSPLKATDNSADECTWGGFKFSDQEQDTYYTLTVKSVSNIACAWQATYLMSEILGAMGCTGVNMQKPMPYTTILLAQAQYEIWISKTTGKSPYKIYTYTVPATGKVSGHVTFGTPQPHGSGWTPLSMPSGGQWIEGTPGDGSAAWPASTVTWGTGAFQATLSWTNNVSHSTDLDLILYGPNNMKVYFANKKSADESVELDRDWLSEWGNANENIYSIGTMPKGDYSIKVHRYSGDATNFIVRVIRSGKVKSYPKAVAADFDEEIVIETFKIN
jgi:hypothetical protein